MGDLSRNFDLSEFAQRRPYVPVPEHLLPNVRRLARNLEVLRAVWGEPILIRSAYRTKDKNRRVGGGSRSQHLTAKAVDFTVRGVSNKEVYCTILRLIKEGRMEEGGLGWYGPATSTRRPHIHYDVRGRKARWNKAPLPACPEEEDDMLAEQLKKQNAVAGMFAQAQGLALKGKPLSATLKTQLRYFLALAG